MWGQVLLFALAHTNAIYTRALDCGQLRSVKTNSRRLKKTCFFVRVKKIYIKNFLFFVGGKR